MEDEVDSGDENKDTVGIIWRSEEDCIVEVSTLSNLKENGKYSNIERVDPGFTSGLYYNTLYINEDKCIRCYACVHACPANAISPGYALEPKTLRKTVEA